MTRHCKKISSYVIDGITYPVLYKGYVQSKSLKLRYTPDGHSILITGPQNFSRKIVDRFLENSLTWLCAHKPAQLKFQKFLPGISFPCLGENLTIHHHQCSRKSILKDKDILHVMSPSTDINNQVRTWVIQQTKIYFEALCYDLAHKMNVVFASIRISDSKTRWGSCQLKGKISLSWRLAFAPLFICQYVAVHELSHLIEMNHSAAFWKIVALHDPHYQLHRNWLKHQGHTLHQWGC